MSPHFILAAGFNWESFSAKMILPFIVLFALLLVPHWIAAKLLAPRPIVWLVIAAAFLQIVFAVGAALVAFMLLALGGEGGFVLVFLVVLTLSALVTAGIYGFGLGKGFLYNFLVACLSAAMGWGVQQAGQAGLFEPIFGKRSLDGHEVDSSPDVASGPPGRSFATSQEAQSAAIQRYPDLAVAGSPFNQRFLEKHKRYQAEKAAILSTTNWPWTLAQEVAVELNVP